MAVKRHRQVEQRLKQPVHMRRGEEIGAARDERDALRRVVHGDGEVIARRRVFPGKDDVAERQRIGRHGAGGFVRPGERPGQRQCLCHVEAQREGAALADFLGALGIGKGATGARIYRPFRPLRRIERAGDVGARAKARIDEPRRLEPAERRAIVLEMARLAPHIAVPVEPEPGQILEDRGDEFLAAAAFVDVLDAQEKAPALLARAAPGIERGKSVAQMQEPGRARREPRHQHGAAIGADDSGRRMVYRGTEVKRCPSFCRL